MSAPSLINGLGGDAGFGEITLPRTDDSMSEFFDLTSVFPLGLNLGGVVHHDFRVGTNGGILFNQNDFLDYFVQPLTEQTAPGLYVFHSDIQLELGPTTPSPGGTSTGSNLIYVDLDADAGRVTVTWDDVNGWDLGPGPVNAFQVILSDASDLPGRVLGDVDIEYRYEHIDWTAGDFYPNNHAVAGYVFGADPVNVFELPGSGGAAAMLALPTTPGNTGQDGIWRFSVENDVGLQGITVIAGPDVAEAGGMQALFTLTRSGDVSQAVDLSYTLSGEIDSSDIDAALSGTLSFAANQTETTLSVPVLDDGRAELDETLVLSLSTPLTGLRFDQSQNSLRILDDDPVVLNQTGTVGFDVLIGDVAGNTLAGRLGSDVLMGLRGDDTILGNTGRDTLDGGEGDDFLLGGNGADLLLGMAGDDTLYGGRSGGAGLPNVDTLVGGAGRDFLFGQAGPDLLLGEDGNDYLRGGFGADTLNGGVGHDALVGNGGADRLESSAGRDVMRGGSGIDSFVFTPGFDETTVRDFRNGIDRLVLDTALFGEGVTEFAPEMLRDFSFRAWYFDGVGLRFPDGGTVYFENVSTTQALIDNVEFVEIL